MRITAIKYKTGKGQPPLALERAELVDGFGIAGSPAAPERARQLLLFPAGREADFPADGLCPPRYFANLYAEQLDRAGFKAGDLVRAGSAILKIERLGKDCYDDCPALARGGPCLLARFTLCASVARDGAVAVGDNLRVVDDNLRAVGDRLADAGGNSSGSGAV